MVTLVTISPVERWMPSQMAIWSYLMKFLAKMESVFGKSWDFSKERGFFSHANSTLVPSAWSLIQGQHFTLISYKFFAGVICLNSAMLAIQKKSRVGARLNDIARDLLWKNRTNLEILTYLQISIPFGFPQQIFSRNNNFLRDLS